MLHELLFQWHPLKSAILLLHFKTRSNDTVIRGCLDLRVSHCKISNYIGTKTKTSILLIFMMLLLLQTGKKQQIHHVATRPCQLRWLRSILGIPRFIMIISCYYYIIKTMQLISHTFSFLLGSLFCHGNQ